MVELGYRDAGYEYVNLDDCWQAPNRTATGHLAANPERFPSGIKALADYVHAKGLKLGLYTAMGMETCASHRFTKGQLGLQCDFSMIPNCTVAKRDIDDFVSWGIDSLKVDGCGNFDRIDQNNSYALVGGYLLDAVKARGTGPIVYHPSNLAFRYPRQFRELASIANQWRFYNDVDDSWESVAGIIANIGAGQPECVPGPLPKNCSGFDGGKAKNTFCASHCVEREAFLRVPGKGGWHDPDMLLVGNTPCPASAAKAGMHCGQLTHDEEQTQMAIWSLASAPLLMSNDLASVPAASRAILLNAEVLAIDQDPLGRMCFRYLDDTATTGAQAWRKDLAGGDVAVAVVNMGDTAPLAPGFSVSFADVGGFAPDTRVAVRDLFATRDLGWHVGAFATTAPIPPHGVLLLRLSFVPRYSGEL